MATELEFCLFGPLMVRCGGVVVPVSPGKQRAVLAALLLNVGQMVSLDALAEVLWGNSPPPSARVTVQNYVMRLRKALGPAAGSRISTQPRGYLIQVHTSELDLSRFEAHLHAARAAVRDTAWYAATAEARAGLSLWRGEPLADIDSELLAVRDVPRLVEQRLQALETRIDADLHLGQHAELITELHQLTGTYPLRERLHGLLMLALYRDGRRGEALAAYQHVRRVLIDELGTEPGTRLRELHQQILTDDPALDVPPSTRPGVGNAAPAVPRELPAGARNFTGRSDELDTLTKLLGESGENAPGTVVISAIGGTAGVGKTALAVHWAHRAAGGFPDGQLYANLHGYDPGRPVTPADALAGFLRSLGVTGPDIPAEEAERAARYRSLLAGRRMLVVLDNAGSAEQVRPLLPGTPGCAVVVTSRDALTGLVARDGARRLDLDLLPLQDAIGLLQALIGARVDADPAAAAVLASQCCRLPLALRLAAELAAARPAVPLAELADELADRQRRLDLLDAGGDPRSAVRAVFSWSYRQLDTSAARAFRLLGMHPGSDLDLYAVAALTGTTAAEAGQLLDHLVRAHLIQPARLGRYGMHDLLRAYARELAAARDPEEEQQAALTRLFDHYLHTATVAMDTLHPAEGHWRPRMPPPVTPVPPVTGPGDAQGWLDAERATLVSVTVHAAEHGWHSHATRLAATLFRYLGHGGYHPEAITIHSYARIAARQAGDSAAEAAALNALGLVAFHQGRCEQATGDLEEALALFRQTGERGGQARVLINLGVASYLQGRYARASEWWQLALALSREIGDRAGETVALGNLGLVDLRQGRYQQATGHLVQALTLARTTGKRDTESATLVNLGEVSLRQGAYHRATGRLQQALALSRETGDRNHEASALARLGEVCLRLGRCEQAAGHLRQALALSRETGNLEDEADALNGLGEVLLGTGQPEQARVRHATALGLASQIGGTYQQARAHNGLGHGFHASGSTGQARRHWQQALALYATLGTPEAGQVRAQLIAAGEDSRP
jgi:DNA-binding SARP family transcriptional activator/Tfp pilus assembly protein PilF